MLTIRIEDNPNIEGKDQGKGKKIHEDFGDLGG